MKPHIKLAYTIDDRVWWICGMPCDRLEYWRYGRTPSHAFLHWSSWATESSSDQRA